MYEEGGKISNGEGKEELPSYEEEHDGRVTGGGQATQYGSNGRTRRNSELRGDDEQ